MINRSNYETYFLLYADRELHVAERKQVELFVQLNPDLEEEFLMIRQTILKPDTSINFENTALLLRETQTFINPLNQEEKFILYLDNELNEEERTMVETYITSNKLQQEFSLYRQLSLIPEMAVVFPDKNLLYKKERIFRSIPLLWRSIAAVLLLGVGIWFALNLISKKQGLQTVSMDASHSHILPQNIQSVNRNPKSALKTMVVSNHKNEKQNLKVLILTADTAAKRGFFVHTSTKKTQTPVLPPPNARNNSDHLALNTIKEDFPVTAHSKDLPDRISTVSNLNNSLSSIANVALPVNNNRVTDIARQASFQEDQQSDNYVFYNITREQFNKSKVGGFLRKVKRVLERKNPLGNNKSTAEISPN